MTAQHPPPSSTPPAERAPVDKGAGVSQGKPWRTEGLPDKPAPDPKKRWMGLALFFVGYLFLFGLLTLQDRLSGPEAIPYTEFKNQVAAKNVGELFARGDTIEGELKRLCVEGPVLRAA